MTDATDNQTGEQPSAVDWGAVKEALAWLDNQGNRAGQTHTTGRRLATIRAALDTLRANQSSQAPCPVCEARDRVEEAEWNLRKALYATAKNEIDTDNAVERHFLVKATARLDALLAERARQKQAATNSKGEE